MLLNKKNIHDFFARLQAKNPHPKSDLEYTNPYTLLVAVTLSAQATDIGVNKATRSLFTVADTPQKILNLGLDKLKEHIKTIGLYNTKAKNIMAAAEILVREYNGHVPETREELMQLPGVGRKTANVVLNVAFGHPTLAVDTHIFRVANRTGLAEGKTPDEIEDKLINIIPEEFLHNAHHWLILHGRYVCKARKPECPQCLVKDICLYPNK